MFNSTTHRQLRQRNIFFPPFPAKPTSSHAHQLYASPPKSQAYPTFIPLTQMPPPDCSQKKQAEIDCLYDELEKAKKAEAEMREYLIK